MPKNLSMDAQYEKMTKTPIPALIRNLSLPTIISMLITSIYNMADTFFVGTINTSASAATGVVFSLMAILQAFGFMFGHGAGSTISRKLGAKDVEAAIEYCSTSFFLSIFVGLLIMGFGFVDLEGFMLLLGSTETILPYAVSYATFILLAGPAMTSSCVMNNILRYEGRAFYAMIGLGTGGILNIFLDWFMVGHMHMGIAGAGLATCISQYVSMMILSIPYFTGRTQSKIRFRSITRHFSVVKEICGVGMPSLCRQGLNSIAHMILNTVAGGFGDAAVAAISIVMRIMNFLFCVALGIGQGFQPVSAFNYGARLYSRVKEAFLYALRLGTILMTVFATLGFFMAPQAVQLFRNDPDVIRIGIVAMHWQCVGLVCMPLSAYGGMLFQSIGKGGIASFLASLRSGLLLIPILLLLTRLLGLSGLEMAQALADLFTAIITIPFVVRFFKELPEDAKENG